MLLKVSKYSNKHTVEPVNMDTPHTLVVDISKLPTYYWKMVFRDFSILCGSAAVHMRGRSLTEIS